MIGSDLFIILMDMSIGPHAFVVGTFVSSTCWPQKKLPLSLKLDGPWGVCKARAHSNALSHQIYEENVLLLWALHKWARGVCRTCINVSSNISSKWSMSGGEGGDASLAYLTTETEATAVLVFIDPHSTKYTIIHWTLEGLGYIFPLRLVTVCTIGCDIYKYSTCWTHFRVPEV